MNFKSLGFAGMAIAMSALPAFAHHSFAMFDGQKKTTLAGTVRAFQWVYPHSWILLMVPDAAGQPQQWAIEMGSPGGLAKAGWLPKTLKPGMKVTAVIHPLKDGTRGGQYLAVTLADGRMLTMGNGGGAPVAPARE